MLKNLLCKIGYHNEKNLVIEVKNIGYITSKKLISFKCDRCGKVFQKAILTNDITVKRERTK